MTSSANEYPGNSVELENDNSSNNDFRAQAMKTMSKKAIRRSLSMIEMNEMECIKNLDSCTLADDTTDSTDTTDDASDDDGYFNFDIDVEVEKELPKLEPSESSDTDEDFIIPTKSDSMLRRCKSQSILKLSSVDCDRPKKLNSCKPSFSTLEIREYNITLGDNPGGAQGPPVSLDWVYNKRLTQVIALEDYEEQRGPRRSRAQMHMAENIRRWRLLRENGVSLKEMEKAAKEAESVRKQRRKSMHGQAQPLSALRRSVGRLIGSGSR